MKKIIVKLTLITLVVTLAACSSTPVRRSAKETWTDTMTASKVRYKLMKDKEVHKGRMHVEVYRGEVTLTGRAATEAEKARAETLAKSVKHVTGVENYVHIVGTGKPDSAVAVAAPITPVVTDTITEKVLVKEEVVVSDNAIAAVPTVRESTGKPARLIPGRKASEPKKVASRTKAPAKIGEDDKPAAIRKVPAEPAQVVGRSSTGLPWDGEVYEDDTSSVTPVAASKAPAEAIATRTPAKSKVDNKAPVSQPTDDLAAEAAQELEKLRSKR